MAALTAGAWAPPLPTATGPSSSKAPLVLGRAPVMVPLAGRQQRRCCAAAAAAPSSTSAATAAPARPADPTIRSPDDATLAEMSRNLIKGYSASQYVEHGYWIQPGMVEGVIPPELSGTLLRNGPALFEVGGRRITQPFDGDGMVCTFAFQDGRVFFRNKFVRTEGLVNEQASGKSLYRSAFNKGVPDGALFSSPFDLSVKNVANTNVMRWGGKTLALYERGLPYQLDNTLATLGTTDLGGSIDKPAFFGAHYRVVPPPLGSSSSAAAGGAGAAPDRLAAFSFGEAGNDALLTMWEYDTNFKCLHKIRRTIPGAAFGFFHDIAVTPRYYVFLQNPIRLDLWKLFTEYTVGKACIAECLIFDPSLPVKVHLIPRPGGVAAMAGEPDVRTFELRGDPFFSFHHVNAYEAEGGRYVVVDTCAMNGIDFGKTTDNSDIDMYKQATGRDELSRVVVDTQSGKVERHVVTHRTGDLPGVSPLVMGRPHRHSYLMASVVDSPQFFSPSQTILKVTMPPELGVTQPFDKQAVSSQVWFSGLGQLHQEPVFVPRPGAATEDDGWVLAMMLDTDRMASSLVILDGRDLTKGPLAKINLPHHIPLGLHGSFTPDYLGPAPGSPDAAPYNIKNGL